MKSAVSPGLQAVFTEMDRQGSDAVASFEGAGPVAIRIAASMRRSGRVVLLGMGGSHAINRIAEILYRRAGLDATALPVSEALYGSLPDGPRTLLLTSQSGESGEIVRYLDRPAESEERFGLTLDAGSTLARAAPGLVGHGGTEQAFAATRSLTVSLALHARVLHELGIPVGDAMTAASIPASIDPGPAADRLADCRAVVFSGRAAMQGVAEAGALSLMELARIPCFALEGGQLRHGPVEALGPDLGVVLIRAADASSPLAASMARLCIDAGVPPVILDASGDEPIAGAVTVALPPAADLPAAFSMLLAMQHLVVEVARRRVADAGTPVRSTKVTRSE